MRQNLRSMVGNLFPKLPSLAKHPADEKRPYRVVQIEVTSRCTTGCVFCPHDALAGSWVEGDLPLELYREKIVPNLDLFSLVYLQGWGEPMLHPDLWEMLNLAHQNGCNTGFTTNGSLLENKQNNRLIDLGVSMISVSFAGQVATMHESLRTKSDFVKLCRNFENLANLKVQKRVAHPWLELHFLMTRANLSELPALIPLAASLGADEMVATNLTYAPNLALDRMHIFAEQPLPEDLGMIELASREAARLGLPLRIYPIQFESDTLVCDADPLNTIYINHRGQVTPCVYLGFTMQGRVPRFYQGEAHPFDTLSFGSVSTGLIQALQSKERARFLSPFKHRQASMNPVAVFNYMLSQGDQGQLTPPPLACQHCYKMLGV